MFVGEQDIQPLRVLHLGGDEVPQDALKQSPVCRHLLQGKSSHAGVNLRLHFMRLAVDIAARLGVDTVQVRVDSGPDDTINNSKNLYSPSMVGSQSVRPQKVSSISMKCGMYVEVDE